MAKVKKIIFTPSKIRVIISFLFFLLLYSIIFVRFFLLQVNKKDFFKNLGNQQYNIDVKVTPPRAQIFERSGKISLALNKKTKSAFVLPKKFNNKKQTMSFLKKYYPNAYKQIIKHPNKYFVWVKRKITKQEQAKISKKNIKDIQYLKETQRFYPFPSLAPVIGFTNIDNDGIAGLELKFNQTLAGTPTILKIEKDARSSKFYFKKEIQKQGENGKPIRLTIDDKLQFLVSRELEKTVLDHEAKEGCVVVINPLNGEILAMTSYPGFDPNSKNITDIENTKNKAVTECYEFGSVMKAITALSALQEGLVTLDEEIDCEGKVTYIDKIRVENWKSVDILPFKDVIRFSSNVGVAKIAKRLDTKLYDNFKKLGFGQPTNLGFPGERSGYLNPPEKWSRSSLFVLSFGYEVSGTIMQLAKAFSIIANGGYEINPKLIMKKETNKVLPKKLYSYDALEQTKDILESIGKKYKVGDFRIMGKTGTARMVIDGKYSKRRHVYTFAGIVEKDDYKRVIITFIKEPRRANIWASELTGPLFQRVAEKMVLHDRLNNNL